MNLKIRDIIYDISGCEFLEPYLRRELDAENPDTVEDLDPVAMVRIVTNDSPARVEADLPETVIKCPNIVGTGMGGFMRRIAASIYTGRYVQIAGNEARISVVHATDVARAAVMAAGRGGQYTLTDGIETMVNDLAEAFAYRIDDKRLLTVKPLWARLWLGPNFYRLLTETRLERSTFTEAFPDFRPVPVVEYLHTHDYDESSL